MPTTSRCISAYLRQKLGDEKHQLIQTVRGVGYRIRA